ncbi:MAG: transcriptional repressor [Candidatus Brocadiae bacterium]|nr:transcriptional repressor [Candidatus Brocadiia bacterium]
MGDERQIFETYLKAHELHLTQPRETVLKAVFATHEHFTADELIAHLRTLGTPVSKATVYRTLALLSECRLLIEHDFGLGRKHYEHASDLEHHGHLYCTDCGQIVEFYDARLNSLQDRISRQEGFEPAQFVVKIYGRCARCIEKMRRAPQVGGA